MEIAKPIVVVDELAYQPVYGGTGVYEPELTSAYQGIMTVDYLIEPSKSSDRGIVEIAPIRLLGTILIKNALVNTWPEFEIFGHDETFEIDKSMLTITPDLFPWKGQNYNHFTTLAISIMRVGG